MSDEAREVIALMDEALFQLALSNGTAPEIPPICEYCGCVDCICADDVAGQ